MNDLPLFSTKADEEIQALRKRLAELERERDAAMNTVWYLKERYFKANKRIAELERDKDLNKIRADAVREAAEATNKGDEIGYFTCCFHELLSYAEKLEAKGSE